MLILAIKKLLSLESLHIKTIIRERVAVNKVQALHSTRPRLQINNNGSEGHFSDHNFADKTLMAM